MSKHENKAPRIAILGGGVSGLTTGIVLQIHGFNTKIYTERRLDKVHPTNPLLRSPNYASIHAAASILPHSVESNPGEIRKFTEISKSVYRALGFNGNFGVRQQRHYELYEDKPELPTYGREVGIDPLSDKGDAHLTNRSIPVRIGARYIYGWFFNAYFVEVPTYMKKLFDLYKTTGGSIEELPDDKTIGSLEDLEKVSKLFGADAYVICAGLNSPSIILGQEIEEIPVTRGHMIRSDIKNVPQDKSGAYFSYNYTPSASETRFRDFAIDKKTGEITDAAADVYFYPRSDCWLLGGSRQEGFVNTKTGVWRPKEGMSREEFEGFDQNTYFKRMENWPESVPKRIWDLNRELIKDITEVDIDRFPSSSYIGYRFATNPIQIGAEPKSKWLDDKPVISNFGHGGSGYTLSWGCAWKCVEALEEAGFHTKVREHRDLDRDNQALRESAASMISIERIAEERKKRRMQKDFSKGDY